MTDAARIPELEERIGYAFRDKELLETALRHSSYTNERHMDRLACNERLEFLGDAVLEQASSRFLFEKYPEKPEGELTKLRASLVCEPTLALDARELGLERFLLLGRGAEATGGRSLDSIVSDAMEALIGAIYLDGGQRAAWRFIRRFVLGDIEKKKLFSDSKTILQEIVQGRGEPSPSYTLMETSGPDHCRRYHVCVEIGGEIFGEGRGSSKKAAEQQAAYAAICAIKEQTGDTCI